LRIKVNGIKVSNIIELIMLECLNIFHLSLKDQLDFGYAAEIWSHGPEEHVSKLLLCEFEKTYCVTYEWCCKMMIGGDSGANLVEKTFFYGVTFSC
jgi:hypothetical protein